MKHLIIGCGPAGLSAVDKIRSLNQEDQIKVVSMDDCLPYSPAALPYLLAGKVAENDIWLRDEEYFNKMKVTFAKGKEVIQLLPHKKQVVYRDGDVDEYDNLLIASGSQPAKPRIPGIDEVGFLGFHTLKDYYQLRRRLEGKRSVTVLGAGLIGMQVAAALAETGYQVRVIEMENRPLPLYLDAEPSAYAKRIFEDKGIKISTGKRVVRLSKANGEIEVACSNGDTFMADLLITCTGVKASTSFIQGCGIKLNQGVIVDQRLQTSHENIYAAGDVVEAPDFFYKQPGISAILPSSIAQGKIAGANMAGNETEYEGWISMNVLNIFGNLVCSIGVAMPQNRDLEVLEEKDDRRNYFKRLVFQDNRLIGAALVNVEVMPGVIRYLIENRVDMGRHKELLFAKPKETSCWLMSEVEKTLVKS